MNDLQKDTILESKTGKKTPRSGEYWRCWVHLSSCHKEIYCLPRENGQWRLGRYVLGDDIVEPIEEVRFNEIET
jgi:hypothetical protein